MGRIKVKMNSAGAKALLNDSAVLADLESRAQRIKSSAEASTAASVRPYSNPEYVLTTGTGGRARASVIAANPHSMKDNAKRNTLIKSIDAGR